MTPSEFWHIYNHEMEKSDNTPRYGALKQSDVNSLLDSLEEWGSD